MRIFSLLILLVVASALQSQVVVNENVKHSKYTFPLVASKIKATVCYDANDYPVVKKVAELFVSDIENVTGQKLKLADEWKKGRTVVIVGTIEKNQAIRQLASNGKIDISPLEGAWERYLIQTVNHPFPGVDKALIVAGSDRRGASYGLFSLSEMAGVSPWYWWADVPVKKHKTLYVDAPTTVSKTPSVKYRGVFLNDEDWGLMPWSNKTYEPSDVKGEIGPRTNERIFELLLRLRANTYWPAMHECTLPFFLTKGNREAAKKYGIFMGASHCEPMACNAAGEWKIRGKGAYDYVNNSPAVYQFWENRVKEVAGQEILYTLGMRGVHDGKMQGAKTVEEQKAVLNRVFVDQRGLLEKYVNKDVTQVPQVFIPYKEVLDIYHAGLQVPEDVTLMWCDDNYGYIRHFPTAEERARKGGNGVYYHVSYWGRPHDHLWLSTMSPSLIYQQMKQAYDQGIQKMWILNVGDIKPAEYQIELFMDMAWNLDKVSSEGVTAHLKHWLERELGTSCAKTILPVMQEHYRLAHIRKPEFMGNTREEEKNPVYRVVKDLSLIHI